MVEIEDLMDMIKNDRREELSQVLAENPTAARQRGADGMSLMMHAVYMRKMEIAEILREAIGELDIFEASAAGDCERLKSLLDDDKGLLDRNAPDGFTPLQIGAYFRHPEAVRVLLDKGADIEAVSSNQFTLKAIHAAAASGDGESLKMLLDRGAEVNTKQQGGWTPLHAAGAGGDRKLAQMLLDAGADREVLNDEGKSPADTARDKGHTELAQYIA